MSRSDLLNKVSTLTDLNEKAVQLAKLLQTDEQVAARFEKTAAQIARFKSLRAVALGAGTTGAFFAGIALSQYLAAQVQLSNMGLSHLLLGLCCAVLANMLGMPLSALVLGRLGYAETLALLGKVADTEFCDVGMHALETGGLLPRAWRDLALQERSELRVFDIQIMVALGERHHAEVSATVRKAQLADSCRKLHDVSPQT